MIALIPDGISGYRSIDYETGKTVKITDKNRDRIHADAICFYKPLPLKSIGVKDLPPLAASGINQ